MNMLTLFLIIVAAVIAAPFVLLAVAILAVLAFDFVLLLARYAGEMVALVLLPFAAAGKAGARMLNARHAEKR